MSKTANMYVDLHVLQTVPPSCVNRDDTGSPKTAVYGAWYVHEYLAGMETRNAVDVSGIAFAGAGRLSYETCGGAGCRPTKGPGMGQGTGEIGK